MLLESRQRRRRIIDSGRQWIVLCVMCIMCHGAERCNCQLVQLLGCREARMHTCTRAHDYSNTGVTVVLGHVSKYTIVYTNMAAITKFSAK